MWALTLLLLAAIARAAIPNAMLRGMPVLPKLAALEHSRTSPDGTTLPPITTVYYFDQLIDHNNAGLGTFQQRNEVGPMLTSCIKGGPIIFLTPGEANTEAEATSPTRPSM
ncbi:hypothetical protein K503DRAFT_774803, partial [Rhizopogon vinicolor AM-OR11-026]